MMSVESGDSGMPISKSIHELTAHGSWVRRMFEEGNRLKAKYGAENVFDFSLGNPSVEPPREFCRTLVDLLFDRSPGLHGYMPNGGYPSTRAAVACEISLEQGIEVPGSNVIMTCGAAGALNVAFKTILDPGDEVVVTRPYFPEYRFYVDNHRGVLKEVSAGEDFGLNLDAIDAAVNPRTRAVLINSPNNPTGRVYPAHSVTALGELLRAKCRETGRIIYLVSDEPYRRIAYDGVQVPPVLPAYENTIIASSYSKELSLAGERIGYLAVNPAIKDVSTLLDGLTFANRILGFVNAPALMQRAISRLQGQRVDLSLYERNRQVLWSALTDAGYTVPAPEGAFYLFPRSPLADDVAFAMELAERRVLVVPGTGFGFPGHFRLSYCVAPEVVDGALPALCHFGKKYLRQV
jgi:aspartate aminotransferase